VDGSVAGLGGLIGFTPPLLFGSVVGAGTVVVAGGVVVVVVLVTCVVVDAGVVVVVSELPQAVAPNTSAADVRQTVITLIFVVIAAPLFIWLTCC